MLTPAQKGSLTKELKAQMEYVKELSRAYKYNRMYLGDRIGLGKLNLEIDYYKKLYFDRYGKESTCPPRVPEKETKAVITLESHGGTGTFALTNAFGNVISSLWSSAPVGHWIDFKSVVESLDTKNDSGYDFFMSEYNKRIK